MGRINVTSVFLRGGSPNGKLVDSALHRLTQHAHERGVARLGRRALNTQQSAAHSNCSLFGRFRRVRSTIQGQPTHLGNAVQVDACNLDPRVVLLLFFCGGRGRARRPSKNQGGKLAPLPSERMPCATQARGRSRATRRGCRPTPEFHRATIKGS